jgi:2-methylcitrate dehydratase
MEKFKQNLARRLPEDAQEKILRVSSDQEALEAMPVDEYVGLFCDLTEGGL